MASKSNASLDDFTKLREMQAVIFACHMRMETSFGKIDPVHDFDSDQFCSHLPAAFDAVADQLVVVNAALASTTSLLANITSKLRASHDVESENATNEAIASDLISSASHFDDQYLDNGDDGRGGHRFEQQRSGYDAGSAASASGQYADQFAVPQQQQQQQYSRNVPFNDGRSAAGSGGGQQVLSRQQQQQQQQWLQAASSAQPSSSAAGGYGPVQQQQQYGSQAAYGYGYPQSAAAAAQQGAYGQQQAATAAQYLYQSPQPAHGSRAGGGTSLMGSPPLQQQHQQQLSRSRR